MRLLKHVIGYQGGGNDFALVKKLESRLWETLVKYSESKPVLVFCATRRGQSPLLSVLLSVSLINTACQSVADQIASCYVNEKAKGNRKLPWQHEA